jgi:hypothetical protein
MPLAYSIMWFIRYIGLIGNDRKILTIYDAIQKITLNTRILIIFG